jgi:hypothetical protein
VAKQSGLGDRLYLGGFDLSGDVNAVDNLHGGPAAMDVTGIDKSANERIGGRQDSSLEFTSWFNTARAHPQLATLPTTSKTATYCRGLGQGSHAAGLVAKQLNYDPKLAADGTLTLAVSCQGSDGFPLEWGRQLTDGVDTGANLLTGANATFEGGIGTWTGGGNAIVAATSAAARTGTGALAIPATTTADAFANAAGSGTAGVAVVAGRQYLVQAWFRAATTARSCRARITWYTSGGSLISTTNASTITNSTSGWTVSTGTLTAPATAAFALVNVVITTPAAAEVHYVDDVSLRAMPVGLLSTSGLATSFGLTAYLQVTAFSGVDATITLHSSSDDAATDAYSAITSGAFAAATGVGAQRIETATGQSVEQYLRPVVTTTGGFDSLSYLVVVCRREV